MIYVWLTLFILGIMAAWGINLIGMPGNWGIVVISLVWFFFSPASFQFSWMVILALVLLALVGEAIEFGASVFGTKKLGGSGRGATLSVVGSVIGGIAGAICGIPIPIPLVGMLIGSILFACIGASVGAMIGEKWVGKPMKESVKIGGAAFAGRLLGTVGKLAIGSIMVILSILAPFIFVG